MIHHVALFVEDPGAVSGFLQQTLGLEEIRRQEDAHGLYSVWLSPGASILMIERADSPAARSSQRPAGGCMLAFEMPDDSAAFLARLEKAGGRVVRRTEFTLYFERPGGPEFAVSAYPRRLSIAD